MTALAAPRPQHLDALAVATEVNSQRAAARRRIAAIRDLEAGQRALAEVLDAPVPHHLRTLNVEAFLHWAYRMHPDRAGSYLAAVPVSPYCPLGKLTDRQRLALAAALRVPVNLLDAWRLRDRLRRLAASPSPRPGATAR